MVSQRLSAATISGWLPIPPSPFFRIMSSHFPLCWAEIGAILLSKSFWRRTERRKTERTFGGATHNQGKLFDDRVPLLLTTQSFYVVHSRRQQNLIEIWPPQCYCHCFCHLNCKTTSKAATTTTKGNQMAFPFMLDVAAASLEKGCSLKSYYANYAHFSLPNVVP